MTNGEYMKSKGVIILRPDMNEEMSEKSKESIDLIIECFRQAFPTEDKVGEE